MQAREKQGCRSGIGGQFCLRKTLDQLNKQGKHYEYPHRKVIVTKRLSPTMQTAGFDPKYVVVVTQQMYMSLWTTWTDTGNIKKPLPAPPIMCIAFSITNHVAIWPTTGLLITSSEKAVRDRCTFVTFFCVFFVIYIYIYGTLFRLHCVTQDAGVFRSVALFFASCRLN